MFDIHAMTTKNEEVLDILSKILNAIHNDSSMISDSPDKIFWSTQFNGLSVEEQHKFADFNMLESIDKTKIKNYDTKWCTEANEVFTDYEDFIKKDLSTTKIKHAARMALIMLVTMALRIYDL